ncbi:MAG: branched-chain amino acid ABC transporter permease [Acidimicrobiia bacterium]|nr:branched-chain amino acid ABC transporter permease [Acidimicrobiia bacterium]
MALAFFLVHGVRNSRTGRVLIALRENERGTQAYGVSVTRAKLTAFALSGFIAAFAGALLVHHQQAFSLNLVSADQNLVVFTAAVVGGLGSMLGAAFGALYLQGGQWFLPAEFQLFTTSIGVLIVLLALPGGLGGVFYRARDLWLRWVANRRGILSPSLVADTKELEAEVEAAFEERAGELEGDGDGADAAEGRAGPAQSDRPDRGDRPARGTAATSPTTTRTYPWARRGASDDPRLRAPLRRAVAAAVPVRGHHPVRWLTS